MTVHSNEALHIAEGRNKKQCKVSASATNDNEGFTHAE